MALSKYLSSLSLFLPRLFLPEISECCLLLPPSSSELTASSCFPAAFFSASFWLISYLIKAVTFSFALAALLVVSDLGGNKASTRISYWFFGMNIFCLNPLLKGIEAFSVNWQVCYELEFKKPVLLRYLVFIPNKGAESFAVLFFSNDYPLMMLLCMSNFCLFYIPPCM